ncbi:hypothetical protein [Massilia pseudoviolaceinigra]|uniref:hypothetical protein n=1 Tax=Massilia pseudoviolaceinigra TaxID=3057165 RepID=UPI002796CC36|nr:hypothetical protein [Massilia sp. CCM 9206]MDQ1919330.1 hypothetical protein [Massilia sp. CCM 9206]
MQTVKNQRNNVRRRVILLGLIAGMVGIAILFEWKLIASLLKLREMRVPYVACFLTLCPAALAIYSVRGPRSLWKSFIYGALIGQLAATVSLTLANLFIQHGIERNLRSLEREGLFELLLIDSTVAFVLGGWLIAGTAFVAHEIFSRRYFMTSRQ